MSLGAIGDLAMRNMNWVLTLSGLLVVVLFLTLLAGTLFLPRSVVYGVEARFDALPKSDNEFALWLKDQPGIVPHTVHTKRSGKKLEVTFIQVRNGLGQPRFPKLEAKTKELGYRGSAVMFTDVER
jgi:hypothetical protein